jgi:hypothetical protein
MHEALARVNNRNAAKRDRRISAACFTGHITVLGQGGGEPHETGEARLPLRVRLHSVPVSDDGAVPSIGAGGAGGETWAVGDSVIGYTLSHATIIALAETTP